MHTDKTNGHNLPPYPCSSVVKFFMSDSSDLVAGKARAAVFPFVTGCWIFFDPVPVLWGVSSKGPRRGG